MRTPQHPCDQSYALRLHAAADAPLRLCGRIEHVLSGECRDFDSGTSLLAALQALQAQAARVRGTAPA